MKKRYACFAVWLALACLLYFFENNTGTRIVLVCSLLLPMIPAVRRSLLKQDETGRKPRLIDQTIQAFAEQEEDEPGNVRAYQPGDPVNRIHWKLSAKRDELLVRERAKDQTAADNEKKKAAETVAPAPRRSGKRVFILGIFISLLALILLAAIPSARNGAKALLNRLFEASEAMNAYVYDRFHVPADQPVALAVLLLAVTALSWIGLTILSGSRLAALGLMAGCAIFQIYFGLAFPAWVNVALFVLFALWMMNRAWNRKAVLAVLAGVAAVGLAVLLVWPGVDAAAEAASEAVRDRLSQMAQSVTGAVREMPAGENETRHVHTQSLKEGDQEAQPDREYRLVTVEEEQISMPHWTNYLRILLLLLLTAALVILPFLPFVWLNRQRQKALDARSAFQSENVNEAVFAIFQHVAAWLEATGNGDGNAPYAEWRADLSPGYAQRFAACEKLFEEAAYSGHEMKEEHRRQALDLLNETEQALLRKADWRQRLRLRYKECLWI